MKTLKYNYNLEVTVDEEELKNKYPNFSLNFQNSKEFVDFIIKDLKAVNNINPDISNLENFGFSVEITEF